MERKWVIPSASAVPILAVIYAFSLGPSPHKVLSDFKTNQVPESALLEPLLDADAAEMAPLLIGEIAAKDMVRRRYAIEYLGRIKSKPALPALETILADAREADDFRTDALEAIAAIDRTRAQRHAATYRSSSDSLGTLSRQLLAENPAVVGALR